MLNFLASVMREFYEEIDRKNRIFARKTDILRKCVARCAILLNIYGKKDCFDVSSYNWAHKHHFIVRKTKKTYLSDCENFANVRVNLSKERSVFIKMFIKMFISKEYVEKYGKNNKKINLSINSCQFIAVVFLLQNSD